MIALVHGLGSHVERHTPVVEALCDHSMGAVLPTLSLDNGLDLSQLSHDPGVQPRVEPDPLCH